MATSKDVEANVTTPLLKDIESFPKYIEDGSENVDSTERAKPIRNHQTIDVKIKAAFDGFIKAFTDYDFENNPVSRFLERVTCLKTCSSVCCITIQIVCAALPIAMIVTGAVYLNDCTVERFIPIYLFVAGSFAIAHMLINAIMMIWPGRTLLKWLVILMSLFSIAWLIAGSVWVYRSYNGLDTDTPESANYCHPSAYYLAFWVITSVYAVFGTFIFIIGLIGMVGCCYLCCICCQVSSCLSRPRPDKVPQDDPERFLVESVEKGILAPSSSGAVAVRGHDNPVETVHPKGKSEQTQREEVSIYD